ncbi:MAG: 5-formyltetrahydrofolate cyclo-ligase, partial [Pseudomonadota bacterium]
NGIDTQIIFTSSRDPLLGGLGAAAGDWGSIYLADIDTAFLRNVVLRYGGGYFDRTLAAIDPRPLTIGVAFEILRLDSVHPQPHDIAMDFIVTEAGIYRVTAGGSVAISREECAAEHALK